MGRTLHHTGYPPRGRVTLADNRHLYRNADGSNIAFILTVNDATGMRESLTRTGRSSWYEHRPSREDKANIAWAILDPKTSAERELVEALERKHHRQPVAFWTSLALEMRAIHNRTLSSHQMPDKAAVDAAHGHRLPLVPEIAREAARTVRTSVVRNYLRRTRKTWWGR